MPLHNGKSKKVIGENIIEMEASGHPHDQAVAASLHNADESKMADGGIAQDPPSETPTMDKIREFLRQKSSLLTKDVQNQIDAGNVEAGATPTPPVPEPIPAMADGGVTSDRNEPGVQDATVSDFIMPAMLGSLGKIADIPEAAEGATKVADDADIKDMIMKSMAEPAKKKYADGGVVTDEEKKSKVEKMLGMKRNAEPAKDNIADEAPHAKEAENELTHDEKYKKVMEMTKKNKMPVKMADGGITPDAPPPTDPNAPPASTDPDYWDKIKAALSQLTGPAAAIGNATQGITGSVAGALGNAASPLMAPNLANATASAAQSPALPGIANAALGTNIPTPAPQAPVTPVAAPSMDASMSQPPMPVAPTAETKAPTTEPSLDYSKLFNQDPSKIAEGLNPADRQQAAADVYNQQHTIGSMVAQAIAGFGDAVAARGGVNQNALGDILKMESDRRNEVMTNFDKARQAAVQNFDMKTQMGKNAIEMLAAKDAYGPASPALVKVLGDMGIPVPSNALNKDLPQYFNAATIKANQSIAKGKMYMDATKQASDENDTYNKEPGVLNARQTPEARLKWIQSRTADIMNKSQGNVKVVQHGNVGYLAPQDYAKVKNDPTIQTVAY